MDPLDDRLKVTDTCGIVVAMSLHAEAVQIPLSGATWAAKSEAYANQVAKHLSPPTVWLEFRTAF